MDRHGILEAAMTAVTQDRNNTYGEPEDNFNAIADVWNTYIEAKTKTLVCLEGEDVAAMMSLLKIIRIATGRSKDDNWIDLAGYAACGGEIESKNDTYEADEMETEELTGDKATALLEKWLESMNGKELYDIVKEAE